MSARPDGLLRLGALHGRVVQEAEDGPRGALFPLVSGREEVGRVNLSRISQRPRPFPELEEWEGSKLSAQRMIEC